MSQRGREAVAVKYTEYCPSQELRYHRRVFWLKDGALGFCGQDRRRLTGSVPPFTCLERGLMHPDSLSWTDVPQTHKAGGQGGGTGSGMAQAPFQLCPGN